MSGYRIVLVSDRQPPPGGLAEIEEAVAGFGLRWEAAEITGVEHHDRKGMPVFKVKAEVEFDLTVGDVWPDGYTAQRPPTAGEVAGAIREQSPTFNHFVEDWVPYRDGSVIVSHGADEKHVF